MCVRIERKNIKRPRPSSRKSCRLTAALGACAAAAISRRRRRRLILVGKGKKENGKAELKMKFCIGKRLAMLLLGVARVGWGIRRF